MLRRARIKLNPVRPVCAFCESLRSLREDQPSESLVSCRVAKRRKDAEELATTRSF
jgi:hypothetical protein